MRKRNNTNLTLEDFLDYGNRLLKELNIKFWLDCGTLLGVIRNKQLLPWEKDIDLSVFKKEISDAQILSIVQKANKDGFKVNVYDHSISIISKEFVLDIKLLDEKEDFFFEEKLEPINLFSSALAYSIYSLSSDYEINRSGRNKFNSFLIKIIKVLVRLIPKTLKIYFLKPARYFFKNFLSKDNSEAVPKEYFRKFSEIEFLNNSYLIPKNVNEYLTFRYGKTWNVPIKNWITEKHDGAFLYNNKKLNKGK
jgi:hypothetical protein